MIYLLHFSKPICPTRTTQHYLGWTDDIDERLRKHRMGKGSRLCAVAIERGIKISLAEIIPGNRQVERQLKRQKNHRRLCPICMPKTPIKPRNNPACPNCGAIWHQKTGCDQCGLTPDDISFNPSNQQNSFWGKHDESEDIARQCEVEDYFS